MDAASAIEAPNVASEYARALLFAVGATSVGPLGLDSRNPDIEWAASGAMALTGAADGPALLAPGPLASTARAAVGVLAAVSRELGLADTSVLDSLDGPALLGERAAIAGLTRAGTTSPGGSCHLLRTHDGWIAVNLARAEDIGLLPAWLGHALDASGPTERQRDVVAGAVRSRATAQLVERARLLGLPIAEAARSIASPPAPLRVGSEGKSRRNELSAAPRVVDLSSLWAGPLATHLLSLAGARVIKVESTRRPDGARRGPAAFYDLLNAGKESVALDFTCADDRRALRRLVASADIVVESSRPRALRDLGVDAEQLVATASGIVWVSITGYGRREPEGHWVAFGDDAGAAAGLAMALADENGVPTFCADAVADALAGVNAAAAALTCWRQGRSVLLDVALRDVAAYAASFSTSPRTPPVVGTDRVLAAGEGAAVRAPRAREPSGRAAALGADTRRVLAEIEANAC